MLFSDPPPRDFTKVTHKTSAPQPPCLRYLLVDDGAHQVLDGGQRHIPHLQADRLPGESDLEQEGHAMEGAPGVGGAGGAVAAVGEPAVEWPGRAGRRRRGGRRGRVVRMERVDVGSR